MPAAGLNPEKPTKNPSRAMADILPPERVALARRRYTEGATVKSICVEAGNISVDTLYRCLDGEFDDGSGPRPAPIPRRKSGVRVRRKRADRAALVQRLWRTADRQVLEIEQRLQASGLEPTEREGNARTLATLVKTLRELAAFDEAQARRGGKAHKDDDDDDPVPRDIDEFRREIARRIDALVASRTHGVGSGEAG
jgi:hypothetical protein